MNCQQRWGNPVSVNIEHVRSSFSSVAFARKDKREYEKNNEKRSIFRSSLSEQLRADEQMEKCVNPIYGDWKPFSVKMDSACIAAVRLHSVRAKWIISFPGKASALRTRGPISLRYVPKCNRMKSKHSICDLGKERGCPNSRGKPC